MSWNIAIRPTILRFAPRYCVSWAQDKRPKSHPKFPTPAIFSELGEHFVFRNLQASKYTVYDAALSSNKGVPNFIWQFVCLNSIVSFLKMEFRDVYVLVVFKRPMAFLYQNWCLPSRKKVPNLFRQFIFHQGSSKFNCPKICSKKLPEFVRNFR